MNINIMNEKIVLLYKHQDTRHQHQLQLPALALKNSNLGTNGSTNNVSDPVSVESTLKNEKNYSEDQIERMKLCGSLFNRKASIKKEIVNEFFRREPCVYSKTFFFIF
jgi:hypothetical protein